MLVGGDVIVALDGEPIAGGQELRQALTQYSPGDDVTLTVLRDGEEVEVTVSLEAGPG